jgi:hypothetical protein
MVGMSERACGGACLDVRRFWAVIQTAPVPQRALRQTADSSCGV